MRCDSIEKPISHQFTCRALLRQTLLHSAAIWWLLICHLSSSRPFFSFHDFRLLVLFRARPSEKANTSSRSKKFARIQTGARWYNRCNNCYSVLPKWWSAGNRKIRASFPVLQRDYVPLGASFRIRRQTRKSHFALLCACRCPPHSIGRVYINISGFFPWLFNLCRDTTVVRCLKWAANIALYWFVGVRLKNVLHSTWPSRGSSLTFMHCDSHHAANAADCVLWSFGF